MLTMLTTSVVKSVSVSVGLKALTFLTASRSLLKSTGVVFNLSIHGFKLTKSF